MEDTTEGRRTSVGENRVVDREGVDLRNVLATAGGGLWEGSPGVDARIPSRSWEEDSWSALEVSRVN